ncbi:MAG: TspO and MBR like protein [Candidatus Pacebacteria bacterium GW2011_GWF2_38_9]|nr:MAG: benzodiazepine receptor TspO [candidate division TM6 bacterium GW2011_GWF2_28_16]KKQ08664.1 MAG: TspO and MBR like protein [Candidatus Pacebacteria bacterium GW2011_GWF1_36_5]KKQ89006.1 MAG: TspO and MBR like protein [Candidatus Pacebacteria bacterium GW2011_GWF2_38_9]HAZ73182.1 TspO protein [Candidatus Paceibacterota bacterium]
MKKILTLLVSIITCQLAGAIGSIFTFSAIPNWYSTINKPFFNPPNWLFGPVWTLLYLFMGIALYLILITKKTAKRKTALIVFFTQLGLNSLWSIIFFGLHSPGFAFIEIIFLLIFIVLSILKFLPISKKAAYLLVPYLLWVSFASILNFSIFLLN